MQYFMVNVKISPIYKQADKHFPIYMGRFVVAKLKAHWVLSLSNTHTHTHTNSRIHLERERWVKR